MNWEIVIPLWVVSVLVGGWLGWRQAVRSTAKEAMRSSDIFFNQTTRDNPHGGPRETVRQ